ncbi:MAG: hypothetical protein J7J38_01120 [Candidatus Aenigmarchaeota archaeon]|nr:hypothetical protein [Candidatus Aenigmarchaeota archaeon]
MNKKGQFFIIAAIIITVTLVMIRTLISAYSAAEITTHEETKILGRQLENIKGEYEYIVGTASMQNDVNSSLSQNLANFSSYIRDQLDSEILWVAIYFNSSNQNYSVIVGNFLQDNIEINLTISNSTSHTEAISLGDKSIGSRSFNITGDVNLTLSYALKDESREDIISFTLSDNSTIGFFDISLLSDNLKVRTKDLYERKII